MAILALAPLWIGNALTGVIIRCRDLHSVCALKYLPFEPQLTLHNNATRWHVSDLFLHRHSTQREPQHDTQVSD
jgi:hypothetical protein